MADARPAHLPASAILAELVEACGQDTVTVDWIICRLGDRSFGVVLATLGVLSLIPGAAILAGLLLLYPGVQMAIGRERPTFPATIGKRRVSARRLRSVITRSLVGLRAMERLVRPRWPLPIALTKRLTGALVVALAVVMLALPIPFVGVPFGVATVVLATAYLERDGAVFVAALGLAVLAAAAGFWAMVELLV